MALPTPDGTLSAYSPSSTSPGEIDVSSVPDGSWMLLVAVAGNNGNPVLATAPTDWETLVASFAMNTRRVAIFGKIKDSGDSVVSLTKGGATCAMSIGVVYGTGAADPATWQIGAGKFRNDPPAESVTTTAPSSPRPLMTPWRLPYPSKQQMPKTTTRNSPKQVRAGRTGCTSAMCQLRTPRISNRSALATRICQPRAQPATQSIRTRTCRR